jgi:formate hydrogenlyase subunit 3/multisubunit Na+/H+ antiporter MnhD subunit
MAVLALVGEAPRRRLAFVMVAHTGILLIGVGCLDGGGVAAATVYAVGDGTVKAALWLGLGLLGVTAPGAPSPTTRVSHARTQAGRALLTVGGLATAGLPVFATGLGKAGIEEAASAAGFSWVPPVVVFAAALTGAAILHTAWGWTSDVAPSHPADTERRSWRLLFGAGVALLAMSVAAGFVGRWAASAGARFVDTAAYRQSVLDGTPPRVAQPAPLHLTAGGATVDLLAVGAAMLLASAVGRSRSRAVYGRVLSSPVPRMVRRLHDGSIADSTTWATAGGAAIALLFAVGLR